MWRGQRKKRRLRNEQQLGKKRKSGKTNNLQHPLFTGMWPLFVCVCVCVGRQVCLQQLSKQASFHAKREHCMDRQNEAGEEYCFPSPQLFLSPSPNMVDSPGCARQRVVELAGGKAMAPGGLMFRGMMQLFSLPLLEERGLRGRQAAMPAAFNRVVTEKKQTCGGTKSQFCLKFQTLRQVKFHLVQARCPLYTLNMYYISIMRLFSPTVHIQLACVR